MKTNNLCRGIMHSKVAMSLLVALVSATTVNAQSTAKTKVADSIKAKTAKSVVVDVKKKKDAKKDVKNAQRTNDKWILNKTKSNTTTGTGTPTEFQDGDDLWLRIRDGHKFMQRPTESGIYIHQGKKIAIQ